MSNNWKLRIISILITSLVCFTDSWAVGRGGKGNREKEKKQESSGEKGDELFEKGDSNPKVQEKKSPEKKKRKEPANKKNVKESKKKKIRVKKGDEKEKEVNNPLIEPLFKGQIDSTYQREFLDLMDKLAIEFENLGYAPEEINGITSCICNYNYYKSTEEFIAGGNTGLLPTDSWVTPETRESCISLVNQALEQAGYGAYLKKLQEKLIKTHDICCSVNYYYDREGAAGFHQDSYGRELFVLLIYLNSVDGPELKLKEEEEFTERMRDIANKQLMPTRFIKDAKKVYQTLSSTQEGNGTIQWTEVIDGPGGIVGFVDEPIIHSTPYRAHRGPNGDLLLRLLDGMKKTALLPLTRLSAIQSLKNIILEIANQEKGYYITIDRLKEETGQLEPSAREPLEETIAALYKNLGTIEIYLKGSEHWKYNLLSVVEEKLKNNKFSLTKEDNKYIKLVLGNLDGLLSKLKECLVQEDSLQRIIKSLESRITKLKSKNNFKNQSEEISELCNEIDQVRELLQTSDTVLGASLHTIYDFERPDSNDGTRTDFKHTGSRNRRLSVHLNELQGNSQLLLTILEQLKQRETNPLEKELVTPAIEAIKIVANVIEQIAKEAPGHSITKDDLWEKLNDSLNSSIPTVLNKLFQRSFLRVWVTALPKDSRTFQYNS